MRPDERGLDPVAVRKADIHNEKIHEFSRHLLAGLRNRAGCKKRIWAGEGTQRIPDKKLHGTDVLNE